MIIHWFRCLLCGRKSNSFTHSHNSSELLEADDYRAFREHLIENEREIAIWNEIEEDAKLDGITRDFVAKSIEISEFW